MRNKVIPLNLRDELMILELVDSPKQTPNNNYIATALDSKYMSYALQYIDTVEDRV